jgi:SAM-dependent methyltransferase
MQKCFDRYIAGEFLTSRRSVALVDVGSANVNGSYRQIFDHPKIDYLGLDLAEAPGVELVIADPYRIPLETGHADIVVSGQMLEHCEFFWLSFAEMVRILKPNGYFFLIAPSAGPIHRYPVDCYRFYPDAYRALAKHAGCKLVNVWMDERGPWNDLVGVFQKEVQTIARKPAAPGKKPAVVHAGPEVEIRRGLEPYLDTLRRIHQAVAPRFYLEIGVAKGASLRLAQCPAIGVDPRPAVEAALPSTTSLIQMKSDVFFEQEAAKAVPAELDLAFIDGMHAYEVALRDFMAVEKLSHPATLVVIDDVLPNHPVQAERVRRSDYWTGDVWKLAVCLRKMRPDLLILELDCEPCGLMLVAGLDSRNRVLWMNYNPMVTRYLGLSEIPPSEVLERHHVIGPKSDHVTRFLGEIARLREAKADVATVRKALAGFRKPVKP